MFHKLLVLVSLASVPCGDCSLHESSADCGENNLSHTTTLCVKSSAKCCLIGSKQDKLEEMSEERHKTRQVVEEKTMDQVRLRQLNIRAMEDEKDGRAMTANTQLHMYA